MAQRVLRQLYSDLSGERGNCTTQFGLDGAAYEIDLTTGERAQLVEILSEYVDRARHIAGRARPPRMIEEDEEVPDPSTASAQRAGRGRSEARSPAAQAQRNGQSRAEQVAACRTWARQSGYTVADKGRIAQNIWDAFHEQAGYSAE